MPRFVTFAALLLLITAGCKQKTTGPTEPTATVQSVTVSPETATLASIGETASLAATVHLSNGSTGTQTVTWSSSNSAAATVSGGLVTAVGNGQTTITATAAGVSGSATVTVAQVVASVRLLPGDTVIKSVAHLRGAALDARGNPVAGTPLTWEALAPTITTTNESGDLTPHSTGVARIRITSGALSSTAIVRTVWNVTQLSDLFPLFEYTSATGQRRIMSDVSQPHADARAAVTGPVWTYLETVLPTSGSTSTDLYFTTWPEIWTEFIPFCGGQLLANQTAWTACAAPRMQHILIPENPPADFPNITRFLARQFMLASHNDSRVIPWFVEGYSQWLAGGTVQGNVVTGAARALTIADFKAGDGQHLLAPIDTLIILPQARFYENLPQRTPVAVRMAQSALFVGYLAKDYPAALPAIFAQIRAHPGAGFTNAQLIQEILTQTGKTVAQLETAYLAWARGL